MPGNRSMWQRRTPTSTLAQRSVEVLGWGRRSGRSWGSLASQTHFHKIREGSDELCIQAVSGILYIAVQLHCSILSHDALHHCLSSNNSLENGERELGHIFCYCRSCKNSSTILLGERAYSTTGNSRVHYLKYGHAIQLIAFQWNTACLHSSPDPSLLLRKGVWLERLELGQEESKNGGAGS